jgi:hypothetical protein
MYGHNFNEIYRRGCFLTPWSTDLPIDKDNPDRWANIVKYFYDRSQKFNEKKDTIEKIKWGIITYKPAEFMEFWLNLKPVKANTEAFMQTSTRVELDVPGNMYDVQVTWPQIRKKYALK